MAQDEAVLRIVMQDSGPTAAAHAPPPPASTSQPTYAAPPPAPAAAGLRPNQLLDDFFNDVPSAPAPLPPQPQQQTFAQPQPATQQQPSTFDPVALAKKRLEREQQQAEVDAEYAKLKPPPPPKPDPPFDPLELAKKRVKREEDQAAIDAEYAKLKPSFTDVFDPVEEAKKRKEQQDKARQIDEAYKQMYGDNSSRFEGLLNIANNLRGTIGGIFGTLVGSALDVANAYHKARTVGASNSVAAGAAGTANAAKGAASTASVSGLAGAAGQVAVFTVAIAAAVKAIEALVDFINKQEQKFGEYSPQIAQAQAIAEVRTVMGDFRRAQMVSADLAKYIKARTDVEQKYEDIKVRFMDKILPLVTSLMDSMEPIIRDIEMSMVLLEPLKDIAELVKNISDAVTLKMLWDNDKNNKNEPVDPTSVVFVNDDKGVQVPVF